MKHFYLIFVIGTFFAATSCEQEVTFDFDYTPELCFNCVLNPDSVIQAHLSLTQPLTDTTARRWLEGATIVMREDGQSLGQLEDRGNGLYMLPVKPRAESRYDVTVDVKGHPQLSASTVIPPVPDINLVILDEREAFHYKVFDIEIGITDTQGENFYWIYDMHYYYSIFSEDTLYLTSDIYIDSPYADGFNRFYEIEYAEPYFYSGYVRIPDKEFQDSFHRFNMYYCSKWLFILSLDEHYDKYIKSYYLNRDYFLQELPFGEPIQIHSNIKNGIGIFGSLNAFIHEF